MLLKSAKFHEQALISDGIKLTISLLCLCLLCPIKITELVEVSITLQSLLVLIIPIVFGWKIGGLSVLLYLALGGLGLPVFASYTSGWQKFLGPYSGYYFGFAMGAFVIGYFSEVWTMKNQHLKVAILLVVGHVIILGMGIMRDLDNILSKTSVTELLNGLWPAVVIKVALGSLLFIMLDRMIKGREAFYKK